MKKIILASLMSLIGFSAMAEGSRIGEVSTTFRLLGKNDKIAIDRYDDPRIEGVSCYVSRAETGGVKGSLGIATDPNRFSIACRATGKVTVRGNLPKEEIVLNEKASLFFKEVRVSRIYDQEKNVAVYLVWSTKSVGTDGSAFNSVTAVPLN